MKQPKKLTREQKELLSSKGLIACNFMFHKETDSYLYVVSKLTGAIRPVAK